MTHSSRLLPVLYRGDPAMLKIATIPEEERGSRQLAWWAGSGAARVFELEGEAVLLERAQGTRSLVEMSRRGDDAPATSIMVSVAAKLHRRPPLGQPPELVRLDEWFRSLFVASASTGGDLKLAAQTAQWLLASSSDAIPLHGDLHHSNVLDFGGQWRAIDPKGLVGERTFDFVHLLRNPDRATSSAPGRLEQRVAQIVREAAVDRARLLQWTLAFAGLSAAWTIEDGDDLEADLCLLRSAARLLGGEWQLPRGAVR